MHVNMFLLSAHEPKEFDVKFNDGFTEPNLRTLNIDCGGDHLSIFLTEDQLLALSSSIQDYLSDSLGKTFKMPIDLDK